MRLQHKHIMTHEEVTLLQNEVSQELRSAEKKFPWWPNDISLGIMIIAEEMGEAIKADVQRVWDDRPLDELRQELIQTAAMCLRMIGNIDSRVEARSCSGS